MKKLILFLLIGIFLISSLSFVSAAGFVANLTPSNIDASVKQVLPDNNYATETYVRVQSYSSSNSNTRTFISFNLSSIPSNAIITSANLSLYRYEINNITRSYNISRVTASWTETGITWNNQPAASGSATISVGNTNTWYTWDVTSDIKGFINGSYTNYGWRIRDTSEGSGTSYTSDFYSRDYTGNSSLLPILYISYTIDNTPPNINIIYPQNTTYKDIYSYNLSLNVSASDSEAGLNSSSWKWSLDNGLTNTTFTPNTTLTGLVAGSNTVKVWVKDNAGNTNSTSVTFNLSFTPKINDINVSNASTSYDRNALTNGLVGWWKLDENNTNQVDSSGNGNTGTVVNATFTDSGKIGGGYNFDGVSNYIQFPLINNTDELAFCVWAKSIGGNTGGNTVITKARDYTSNDDGFAIWYSLTTGTYKLLVQNSSGTSSITNTTNINMNNTWTHLCISRTNNITSLYINGAYQSNTNRIINLSIFNSYKWTLSRSSTGSTKFFNGTIDEVRIYNRSLSASEISQLYSVTNPTFQEYANVTINTTITDEDTNSSNLYYSWFVDNVLQPISGLASNIFNYVFVKPSTNVTLVVNDTNNNIVTQTFNVSENFINPTISFASPTPGNNTYQSSTSVVVNFTGTETNLQAGWVGWNGANYSATCTGTSPYYCNKTFSSLADGIYNYTAYANDSVGNQNQTEMRKVTIDTINPLISLVYPTNTTYTYIPTAINFTASDTNLQSCWYSVNSGTTNTSTSCTVSITGLSANQGSNTWLVGTNDSAGNLNSSSITFFVDSIAPGISIISPQNTTYNNLTQLVNISSDGNNIWFFNGTTNETYTAPVYRTFAQGSNILRAYANDTAGNFNSTSVEFTTDTIGPVINFTNPTEISGTTININNILVNVTAGDFGSGLKNITIRLYNSTGGLINSTSSVSYSAPADCKFITNVEPYSSSYADYGTTGAWLSIDYNNDGTKEPFKWISTVSCSSRCSYCGGSGYNATLLASDFNSAGDDIYYLFYGGHERVSVCSADGKDSKYFYIDYTVGAITTCSAISPFYINFTGLANGIYFFNATAYNHIGNSNSTETRNVTINYDITPPGWSNIQQNIPSIYSANLSYFNITWTDSNGIGIVLLESNFSGASVNYTMHLISGNTYGFNSALPAGTFYWKSYANDSFGNLNSSSTQIFTINKAGNPIDVLTSPASPMTYGAASNFSCSNLEGLDTLLYINGADKTSEKDLNIVRAAGNYSVNCTSAENQNYTESSEQINYVISKEMGDITLYLNGEENDISIDYPQQYNITAATLYGNLSIYLDGNDITSDNGLNVTPTIASGYYNITAVSSGDENHSSATITRWLNVTLDITSPIINIVSPQEGGAYGYNESLPLNYSATDEHLDSCWYNLNNIENITLVNCENTTFNASYDGSYTLYLYANDSLGNLAVKNVTFSVFVGAPTIILGPPMGIYLNYHDINLEYTPTDSDLESCELWGDFTEVFSLNQTENNPINGSLNIFNISLNDGTYKWNIRCNDSLGHSSFDGNQTFYVDTVAPSISISEPLGTKSSWTGIPLIFSVSDSSPLSCYYNLTSSTGNPIIGNTLINNCLDTNFNVSSDGDYIAYMKVVDAAGNSNFANSSFSVDTSTVVFSSSGGGGGGCSYYSWSCTGWSKCSQDGKQNRTCSNIGTCSNENIPHNTERNCTYLAPAKALIPSTGKALFDIALTIIKPQITLGENLTARISLINFGNKTNLDVTVNYTITDSNNKIILREKEIVPVGLQNEFIKEFVLPSQITPGEYKLLAAINYEGQEKEANSQGSFEILSGKQGFFPSIYWIIGFLLLIIIVIIVIYILFKRRRKREKNR